MIGLGGWWVERGVRVDGLWADAGTGFGGVVYPVNG
jgi:hypothetical protein